ADSIGGGATVAPKGFYDPALTHLGEYQLKLGAEWPLLDAGRRARERTRASLEAAEAGADGFRAGVEAAMNAANTALEVLRQNENEAAQVEALAWLDRLQAELEAGVRTGTHSRSDAQRARVERQAVQAALLDARQAREVAQRRLAELIGVPGPLALHEPAPEQDALPAPSDSTHVMARVLQLPEVRQGEIDLAREQVALREAQSKNTLQVGLAADAGVWGADLTHAVPPDLRAENPDATLADRLRRDLGASVSVQLKRPILDPSARPSVAARREAVRAATLRRDAAI